MVTTEVGGALEEAGSSVRVSVLKAGRAVMRLKFPWGAPLKMGVGIGEYIGSLKVGSGCEGGEEEEEEEEEEEGVGVGWPQTKLDDEPLADGRVKTFSSTLFSLPVISTLVTGLPVPVAAAVEVLVLARLLAEPSLPPAVDAPPTTPRPVGLFF